MKEITARNVFLSLSNDPQMTHHSLTPSCLSEMTNTVQTYKKCSNVMKVHKGGEIKMFSHARMQVINEKTYQSFWKISDRKWQWGGENALASTKLKRLESSVTHIRKGLTQDPHFPTSALPFRLHVSAHVVPSELTPTPSHPVPRLPKSKSHVTHGPV